MRPSPRSILSVVLTSSLLGTRALAGDLPTDGEDQRREDRLLEEAIEHFAELSDEGFCLAGSSCAERPEFEGPPACLAADDLAACDSRGTVQPAK